MEPYFEHSGITIYHGDCISVLPTLPPVDLVLTDPPYLQDEVGVPIRGRGVAKPICDSESVGMPWDYSLDWMELASPCHWIVFGNYRMVGGLTAALEVRHKLGCIFTWRKPNAPHMARPVPRFDCEFIVWARHKSASCERMGEYTSMVIDMPNLQSGCFATERITEADSGKASHPTQKPLKIIRPFIERLNAQTTLDPFMGTGTTLLAAKDLGRRAIGIEIEERYCEIAAKRLQQQVLEFA